MQGTRDQAAVGAHHEAAHLAKDGDVSHARGDEHFLKRLAHAFADSVNVIGFLLGAIGDANASGQVDKCYVRACFTLQAQREVEEDPRKGGVIIVGDGVACQEGVDAQVFGTAADKHAEGFEKLLFGHAVFGIPGVVHDSVCQLEEPARVKAAAYSFGDGSCHALEEVDMRDVVKIDDGSQFGRQAKVVRRRVVRREHDVLARDAHGAREHELGFGRAVAARSVLVKDGDKARVGVRLDGEVFLKAWIPRKRVAHRFHVAANARLVVQVKRGGELLCYSDQLVFGHKGGLCH